MKHSNLTGRLCIPMNPINGLSNMFYPDDYSLFDDNKEINITLDFPFDIRRALPSLWISKGGRMLFDFKCALSGNIIIKKNDTITNISNIAYVEYFDDILHVSDDIIISCIFRNTSITNNLIPNFNLVSYGLSTLDQSVLKCFRSYVICDLESKECWTEIDRTIIDERSTFKIHLIGINNRKKMQSYIAPYYSENSLSMGIQRRPYLCGGMTAYVGVISSKSNRDVVISEIELIEIEQTQFTYRIWMNSNKFRWHYNNYQFWNTYS